MKETLTDSRLCEYQPCSKPIEGRKHKRFCSNTCRTYQSHGDTVVPGIRFRTKIANAPRCKVFVIECPITHKLFTARYPKAKYHPTVTPLQMYHHNKVLIGYHTLICIDCEKPFNTKRNCDRCEECRAREGRRIQRSKRRARIRKVSIEHVVPFKVFDRDGWRCKECGCDTPKAIRGTIQPNAPELDHIIPLSKGGEHSYNNTQLLCRSCNLNKSNTIKQPLSQ